MMELCLTSHNISEITGQQLGTIINVDALRAQSA